MPTADSPDNAITGPLAPNTLLQNRYLIERLLGGGGMGMVYLAHDQRLANRPCAIKEMVDHFIDPKQRVEANEYFAREADTLAQLRHPAIPAITDRFDQANRHYLVMEYVEGRNLEEELAASGTSLPDGMVIDIARQLCEVLSYLHNFNPPIVYRDMKPSNVMLTSKGKVMLVDFGIARLFKGASKGTMIGTLGFAPPEQYQGQVDPRSDIYSLGATLHYLLTSRDPEKFPPFSFPPIQTLKNDVSANLAGAVDCALAYQVDQRPRSIGEFRDMLLYGKGLENRPGRPAVSSRGGTAELPAFTQPVELTAALERPRGRGWRRAIGLLLFTIITAAAAFGATYVYSDPQLQARLGLKEYIDQLPWKHEELMAKAREHPLKFERMMLRLSTREGNPLSPPKAIFTDNELADARYLSWNATFKNELAGMEGGSEKVEARFFDPNGLQIAASTADRFVGPNQSQVDFGSVALIPDLSDHPRGSYKVALYQSDQLLSEQQFSITEDTAAKARAAAQKAAADAAAAARVRVEEEARKADLRRLAMLEERRANPLELSGISFLNTTKSGTPLSAATATFDAAKVLFVGWEITFKNRLYGLDMNQYRVDAAYMAPDGRTLGSVDDVKMVPQGARAVTFSGRIGNSAGGAFQPGDYTVNFYLNGQYLAQRKFRVVSNLASSPDGGGISGSLAPVTNNMESPTMANGQINGLGGRDSVPLELRLRPQPNGFLHGELVIHESGYGATALDGFIRGDHLEFQVPYGSKTLYFEGERRRQRISGSFQAEPAGDTGSWSARMD